MSRKVAAEDEALIAGILDVGGFSDSQQVIHEALIAFDRHVRLERLRALMEEGIAAYEAGEVIESTPGLIEEIMERAKTRRTPEHRCHGMSGLSRRGFLVVAGSC